MSESTFLSALYSVIEKRMPANAATPMIAELRAERVQATRVWCLNRDCEHCGVVPFEAIGVAAGFIFIDLPKTQRFVCRECNARGPRLWRTGRCTGQGLDAGRAWFQEP
jgi:hypothetical protein